ncbi:hypothetical protein R6Z02_14775 [Carnobacterium maltaromaticum]|uniref:hypothetical protein n=1 Tax=Carnobacterium maltaromaticum TaxID=2751 RepID=UPI00298A4365|nr:hypothetical protein [Carnobacterium maltaromaticum]MDW5525018.1 hypothetical protein [Carnobacterium maltaromaticum]
MFEEDQAKQMYIQRQMELEKEFKQELPMQLTPYKEWFGLPIKDFIFHVPLLIIGCTIAYQMYKFGVMSPLNAFLPFFPLASSVLFLQIKSEERENITLARQMMDGLKFQKREKEFMFDKQEKESFDEDIRSKLGIFDITSGCYETIDDRLVKVLKVSTVNLDTMPKKDKERTLKAWENYIEDADIEWFPINVNQYTKPVNLTTYLSEVRKKAINQNKVKQAFIGSYIDTCNSIQQNRTIVTKTPYYIIDVDGTTPESLKEIDRKSQIIKGKIENMLQGRYQLSVSIVDNEELFNVIYSVIDYENAQANINFHDPYNLSVSLSQEEMSGYERERRELEKIKIL